jgi:putative FmdB family regulatory protein
MPTYSYKCDKCTNEYEAIVKMADRDVPTTQPCTACGQLGVIRTPGIGGHQFNDVQKPSGDWKNLLENLSRKNSTPTYKSTINVWAAKKLNLL